MNDPLWIWQQPDWPQFNWQAEALAPLLRSCSQAQGRLLGMLGAVGSDTEVQSSLDAMLQNIVTSSAIEGEQLNVGSVRSSLARRLGLHEEGRTTSRSEGLAELLLDATHAHQEPLDEQRLFTWHRWLFPTDEQLLTRPLHIGALRGEGPCRWFPVASTARQSISKPLPRGAGSATGGLSRLVRSSRRDASLDPFLRAGIAHFWFVTLHPFDDGNGRLTRAITDLALAQGEQQAIRFYAMSASILDDRAGYYRILEASQKSTLDITNWLQWFLATLLNSLEQALARIDRVLVKARFWQAHRSQTLSAEQVKVLNRLLDGGERGFEEGISAAQYQAVAKVSKATATRHLSDLLEKGCIERLPGRGRSTRYQIAR
ncbi:Fic family protein [Pseudomonas aeruginosa]|nr:Fic family protein [Pseudomonas aeruginosa]